MAAAFTIVILLVGTGLLVWSLAGWGLSDSSQSNLAGLSGNVLGGAVVAGAVYLMEAHSKAREQLQNEVQVREAERRALHIQLATHSDPAKLNLIGSDLRSIRLQGKDLTGANLSECDLESADLVDAIVRDGILTRARLDRARLRGAIICDADPTLVSAVSADFSLSNACSVTFNAAILLHASFAGADLTRCSFINANLGGANLTGADARGANFFGAALDNAILKNIKTDEFTIGIAASQ